MNFDSVTQVPRLIESHVKNCIHDSLQQCHSYKMKIYAWVFNWGIFVAIAFVIFGVLFFCRRAKLRPYEIYENQLREEEYIKNKIREFQAYQKTHTSEITNLPSINKNNNSYI
jgi:hypothetical protein